MMYQIKVRGRLDPSWSNWIQGMDLSFETDVDAGCNTVFTGPVIDQPALRGVMNQLWDLNLVILSVNVYEPQTKPVQG